MINTTSRSDLEMEILKNDSLYKRFDEEKFLSQAYTHMEIIEIVTDWIVDGDE